MLQTFKSWPNTTTAVVCVVVLAIVFLLSVATSPADHRIGPTIASPALAAQPDDSVYKETVRPQPDLPQDHLIDYSVVFPQE